MDCANICVFFGGRQQAVSGLTTVRPDAFQGSGKRFTTFGMCVCFEECQYCGTLTFGSLLLSCTHTLAGFEYWANPSNRDEGFITWQTDGQPSVRMGATAVGPDQNFGGSGVGRRLIPEEPMSIVLNLEVSGMCF